MTSVKIENYSGSSDTFTFPYNPQSFDIPTNPNHTVSPIKYRKRHILISGGGFAAKNIVLTGHFSGSSRFTNYRSLSKHFGDTTSLKKLFFESDKFWLGVGSTLKRTHSGGRTLFIDYVANFQVIVGVLFSDTESTSGTNDGDATTFVTEVSGDWDGSGDVVLSDGLGNETTIPASALTAGDSITYKLVEMVDSGSGIYVSEYGYVTINGTQTEKARTTDGDGLLRLASGSDISTVNGSNLTSLVKKFRDGWND